MIISFVRCVYCLLLLFFYLIVLYYLFVFFFFNDTATTEIYTLSLHDALPIFRERLRHRLPVHLREHRLFVERLQMRRPARRSEEHTSELQSRSDLVCRLLLEKKKKYSRVFGIHRPQPCIASRS